ncbi:hypothetical protein BKM15_25975 [Pseudomonas syringae pv. syringae]|nr:hypothetical protein BKM15_25975 [Pseudomonas syringae pv. syringae]
MSFLYKGISSDSFLIVEKVNRSVLPPLSHVLAEVPKKPGAYHQYSKLGVRQISFTVRIIKNDIDELNDFIRNIAEWLYSENPEELILNKEPDKYYRAILDGDTNLEEIVIMGTGTLTFICTDPIAFDVAEQTIILPTGQLSNQISVGGTFKTFPIIEATFTQPSTFFAYSTDKENEAVILGSPVNVSNQTSIPLEELMLDDRGGDLTPWTSGGTVTDQGNLGGVMRAVADSPGYLTYGGMGTGADWHGPGIKRALPQTLDNWRVAWMIKFNNDLPTQLGLIELYLLDSNGAIIHKLKMHDSWTGKRETYGVVRLGNANNGHEMIDTKGPIPGAWNGFVGLMQLTKHGNRYDAFIGMYDNVKKSYFRTWHIGFTDSKNLYSSSALAQVELRIAQHGTSPIMAYQNIYQDTLQVWKRNIPQQNEVEYIVEPGDVLRIDHLTKEITLNGLPFKKYLSPFSKLFSMQPGLNNIGFEPNNIADINVMYRNRWL